MAKSYQTSDFGDPPERDPEAGVPKHPLEEGAADPERVSNFFNILSGGFSSWRSESIEISPTGGKNSKIAGRWDLLDSDALTRLAAVLEYGATKYSEDNWRLDPVELHLKHALEHIFHYLKMRRETNGQRVPYSLDGSKDELGHAFTRVMFALAVEYQDEDYYTLVQKHNGVNHE